MQVIPGGRLGGRVWVNVAQGFRDPAAGVLLNILGPLAFHLCDLPIPSLCPTRREGSRR